MTASDIFLQGELAVYEGSSPRLCRGCTIEAMWCACICSYSQVQTEAEAITEEDLRLIQERESSIRQLEVSSPLCLW